MAQATLEYSGTTRTLTSTRTCTLSEGDGDGLHGVSCPAERSLRLCQQGVCTLTPTGAAQCNCLPNGNYGGGKRFDRALDYYKDEEGCALLTSHCRGFCAGVGSNAKSCGTGHPTAQPTAALPGGASGSQTCAPPPSQWWPGSTRTSIRSVCEGVAEATAGTRSQARFYQRPFLRPPGRIRGRIRGAVALR
jgi:hypothetical protein